CNIMGYAHPESVSRSHGADGGEVISCEDRRGRPAQFCETQHAGESVFLGGEGGSVWRTHDVFGGNIKAGLLESCSVASVSTEREPVFGRYSDEANIFV